MTDSEKSSVDRIKDVVIYAPLGVIGFVKDNAPTFIDLVVAKGKSQTDDEVIEPVIEDNSLKAKLGRAFKREADHLTGDYKKSKNAFYSFMGAIGLVKDNATKVEPLLNKKGKAGTKDNIENIKKRFSIFKKQEIQVQPEVIEVPQADKNIIETARDVGIGLSKALISTGTSMVNTAISKAKDIQKKN